MQTSEIIVIAGPTASGKSGLALALAERLDGVVINADSMQVYRDIPILAAAPSASACSRVPHRLYGIYDASVHGNVVDWLELCKAEIAAARARNKTPVIVGGTGMYIEALTEGVTPIPETPGAIRSQIALLQKEQGLAAVYDLVAKNDPETAARLSPNDATRLRRAAAIWYSPASRVPARVLPHGCSPRLCRNAVQNFAPQDFFRIYIKPPRDILDARARIRFDLMMQQGALKEVQELAARNLPDSLPAMRALGVQELKAFLNGQTSLEEAVELAKLHTRQYAKRQSTWFNNRFSPDLVFPGCFKTSAPTGGFPTNDAESDKFASDSSSGSNLELNGSAGNKPAPGSSAGSNRFVAEGITHRFAADSSVSKNFVDEVVDNLKKRYKMLAK